MFLLSYFNAYGAVTRKCAASFNHLNSLLTLVWIWGLYPLNTGDYNPHTDWCQSGGERVIVFDKLWDVMKEKGVSTYLLREKCGIDNKTVRRLRANDNMETKTLNKLCSALDCRLEDIAEYVPDE